MLILNRKLGESIVIDGNIEITITDIGDGKVAIGIEAPRNIKVFRKEIYEEIIEENRKASNVSIANLSKITEKLK